MNLGGKKLQSEMKPYKERIMPKLVKNTKTGKFIIIEWKDGAWKKVEEFDQEWVARKEFRKTSKNIRKREKNAILSDLTGISARQAKIDMGVK